MPPQTVHVPQHLPQQTVDQASWIDAEDGNKPFLKHVQRSLTFLIGFLICISTIRLWKVLRWNYTFRTCENALLRASTALIAFMSYTVLSLVGFSAFLYLYISNLEHYYSTFGRAFSTLLVAGFAFHKPPVQIITLKSLFLGVVVLTLYWFVYIVICLNLFITVVIYYYVIARAYYEYFQIQYGMGSYLKEEIAYQMGHYEIEYRDEQYFANISDHVLRHPWDIEPIAASKPTQLKHLGTFRIANNCLHIMRYIAKGYLTDCRLTNMRIISISTILELGIPEDYMTKESYTLKVTPRHYILKDGLTEESQLFHYGLENGIPKTIPDSRLNEMNILVNYYYYHICNPSPVKQLDSAMNKILWKIGALTPDVK